MSARPLSQGDTGPPVIYSKGEPPAIQMQGLSDLTAPPEVSQPPAARVVPAEEQAAAVPADSTPLPPSCTAVSDAPSESALSNRNTTALMEPSTVASRSSQGWPLMQAARDPRVLRRLHAGDAMAAGDKLESSNGLSTAILQEDGNFVVRCCLWAFHSPGTAAHEFQDA